MYPACNWHPRLWSFHTFQQTRGETGTATRGETATRTSTSQKHHSPRKAVDKSSQLFPPECMFCGHLEAKLTRKTERPIKFIYWK